MLLLLFSSNIGALANKEYPFFAITPRSTLTTSVSACLFYLFIYSFIQFSMNRSVTL